MSYQKITGPLMAKLSEGYCGQDAYTDMFITENRNGLRIGNGQYAQLGLHRLIGALNCMHDQQAILGGVLK